MIQLLNEEWIPNELLSENKSFHFFFPFQFHVKQKHEIKISMERKKEKKNRKIYCRKCSFNCEWKTFCRIKWKWFVVQKKGEKNEKEQRIFNWSSVAIVRPEFRIRSMKWRKMVFENISYIYCTFACTRQHSTNCCCNTQHIFVEFRLMSKYFNGRLQSVILCIKFHSIHFPYSEWK